jgi:hypothetical protein
MLWLFLGYKNGLFCVGKIRTKCIMNGMKAKSVLQNRFALTGKTQPSCAAQKAALLG